MWRALLVLLVLTSPSMATAFSHQSWDELLHKNVTVLHDGQASTVNYSAFAAQAPRLRGYLASLSAVARTEFDHWTKQAQLAFLINAYNAWTVSLVLEGYPHIDSIKDLGGIFSSPWKKQFIPLLGATRSLDEIEHGLIRGSGRYEDPRVHFAVNCASISCPALRAEAYVADRLDMQLEDQAKQFLSDRSRNRFEKGSLRVSATFDWYGQDFAKGWRGARSLSAFLGLYAEALGLTTAQSRQLETGKLDIHFLNYDWRLNASGSR